MSVSVNSHGIFRRSIEYEIIVRESKPMQRTPSLYHVVHRTAKYYTLQLCCPPCTAISGQYGNELR